MLESLEVSATDVILLVLLIYVVYKLFLKKGDHVEPPQQKQIPPLEKQDLTVEQLSKYNGIDDEHICFAILGKVYDVTRGKDFYGPDGAYGNLAGHDATRALGSMDVKQVKNEYDDLSDMAQSDLDDAREWAERLAMKYPIVGRLLAPGEEPLTYPHESEQTEAKTQ
ncbi:cytochrome b5-like heme/Steroid binding domain-containing protein [Ditylenchus destructor]|nr:cytochrome b5-like heme/Steroid binding domain-containing protein [Ditylenchus destructor]